MVLAGARRECCSGCNDSWGLGVGDWCVIDWGVGSCGVGGQRVRGLSVVKRKVGERRACHSGLGNRVGNVASAGSCAIGRDFIT